MIYKSSSPTKDGRCWQFRIWYDDGGKRKQYNSKKFVTKKEAQKQEALYLLGMNKCDNTKLGDAIDLYLQYISKSARRNTIRSYTTSLTYFEKYKGLNITDFGVAQYNDFISERSSLSVNTINLALRVIRLVLAFANNQLGIDTSKQIKVFKSLKQPLNTKLKYYTKEQYETIISNSNYADLFTTLYYCGLRIGEARGLQWKDIDFENNTISITKQISSRESVFCAPTQTKTPTSIRTLPMFKCVLFCLKMRHNRLIACKDFSSDWFVFGSDKAFCTKVIETELKEVCIANGIEPLGCHAFRHSCASNLLNNGASIYLVSKYLGHSSVDITTRVYAHLLPNTLCDLVNFIEKQDVNKT